MKYLKSLAEGDTSKTSFESVLAYKVSDLMLAVRIEEICRAKGRQFSRANSFDELVVGLNDHSLLVCDLTLVSQDLVPLKKISEQRGCKVFGYYPHVDKETESLARSTGIDFVVPRSALQAKLRSLLS